MENHDSNYTVGSLSGYIKTLKEEQLKSCISRGENHYYPSLNAAAFRRNSSLNIENMVNEFQNYVGNSLTEMQNKHFLAFSQHHGLPTNLLDFTYSPLISLYFACIGNAEELGYVYFIKNERLINITHNLELITSLLLSHFLIPSDEISDLLDKISNTLAIHDDFVLEFLNQIDIMIGRSSENEAIHDEIQNILESIKNGKEYEISMLKKLIILMDKRIKDKEFDNKLHLRDLGFYNHIFIRLLHILIFTRCQYNKTIDLPFYFIYEPANITSRISNQSSVLIYQLYGVSDIKQSINPDYTITIQNKSEILKDLDHMGINEKFIFNDYDHIASYIKQKHLELSDEQEKTFANLRKMANTLLEHE